MRFIADKLGYLLLPHLEKHFPAHENQFAYRPATGCIDAITVLKETIMYYNSLRSDFYCAMLYLLKPFGRIIFSLLCYTMRETELPGQVIALIDFKGKNASVNTSYRGQLSDEWNVKNGVRHGGVSSGMLFNF